jgi:hypothetical protein
VGHFSCGHNSVLDGFVAGFPAIFPEADQEGMLTESVVHCSRNDYTHCIISRTLHANRRMLLYPANDR